MRLTNIVWTTAIIAAAIILTAVLSTASLRAAGAGGTTPETVADSETEATAPVAPRFLSQTGIYSNAAMFDIDSRNRIKLGERVR